MTTLIEYGIGALGAAIFVAALTFNATYNTRYNPQGPTQFVQSLGYAAAAGIVTLAGVVAYIIWYEVQK